MPAPVRVQVAPVRALAVDVDSTGSLMFTELKTQFLKTLQSFQPVEFPPAGLYHFEQHKNGDKSRVHLRLEADGKGLVLVNASRSLHLNPTAAFMAYLVLNKVSTRQAIQSITHRYSIPASQAKQDYAQFAEDLEALTCPDGACPVCELNLDTLAPFSTRPSAPYRMDLALTYRCNNNCAHCYNARPRTYPELSTDEWKSILDKLWQIGIPHIVFTGGEPTTRSDLPELIAHAEKNGQITGINSNGRKLKDPAYVQQLVDAGLDHVQITLESHLPGIHDQMVCMPGAWEDTVQGIKNVLSTRLFVMTNTTLLQQNTGELPGMLTFLEQLKVPTFGLNALIYSGRGESVGSGLPEEALPPLLEIARQHSQRTGQKLIWYTPTQYCHFDPMMLELGVKGCTAALYNMCIEPDGNVIPCQSYYQPLGNLLNTDWPLIWNHDLAVRLRERKDVPGHCLGCSLFSECGGGCPLARPHLDGGSHESH